MLFTITWETPQRTHDIVTDDAKTVYEIIAMLKKRKYVYHIYCHGVELDPNRGLAAKK